MHTESVLFTVTCIVAAIIPLSSLYRQFQMLQQNSYYPVRYIKWLYNSYFTNLLALTAIFCALSVVFKYSMLLELLIIILFIASQVYLTVKAAKKSIKKLAFTKRVIRLLAAAVIIQTALCATVLNLRGVIQGVAFSLLIFLGVFSPVLTLLCWAVTYPFEKAVAAHYINDAKKTVQSMPELLTIGVTGSYGKTGTKFILSRILSEKFNVAATPKSYNTTMGVVRTVRSSLRPQTQVFICEMGAKNIGDIKEICDIVHPKIGIISAVGPQHLDTFGTVDNVFKTKFELYDECIKNGGKVFVNGDSEQLAKRLGQRQVIKYGISDGEYTATNISYTKDGASFTLKLADTEIPVTTRLMGKHNVINITGAAAVAHMLGVTDEDIKFAVSRLEPTEHRLQLKSGICKAVMIDDAYNANPEGCIEAVNVLSHFGDMKKVIITPGLVELGNKEYDFNYKLGLAATKVCDEIILVGQNRSKPMCDAINTTDFPKDSVHVVSSYAEALQVLSGFADENTVYLVENDLPDNYLN